MPDKDNDLLARLNALKPSSVNLRNGPNAPALDVEVEEPKSVEDKLADRLKGLRSGATPAKPSAGRLTAEHLTSQTKDDVVTGSDPIRDWQGQGNGDEPDLEALLAELGPDDQWKLDPEDPKNIDSLLKEAKDALPEHAEEAAQQTSEPEAKIFSKYEVDAGFDIAGDESGEGKNEDQRDEADADDYVKRVLAELEFDRKYGISDEPDGTEHDDTAGNTSTLILPSTPSNLPQSTSASGSQAEQPPSYEDSELAARFSSLGLNLPSTPSGPPSARIKSSISAKISHSKKKDDLSVYADEDIDSWCCICNDDGTVRCLGCDGDIYCDACWREGHGNGPGQERGHKAVQYSSKGGAGGPEGKKRVAAA